MSSNQELAQIFSEIALFLEAQEVPFKPAAYERAAQALSAAEKDAAEIYREQGLEGLKGIPGVGESLAEKIEEYLKTGRLKYYQQLRRELPIDLRGLTGVEGVGPKMARELWRQLKIRDLADLEKAARAHRLRSLPRFGEKTEANILQGIAFLKRSRGRFLLGEILPQAQEIVARLKTLKEVEKIDLAGSLRRRKETIGDVDLLVVSSKPRVVTDFFVHLPGVIKVWGQGQAKASIRLAQGYDIDLRLVPRRAYGAALQYFTGSKEHNIATRQIALEKGLKLNEYGLFRGRKIIAAEDERDIYRALGLDYPAPELRENQGEIEAALRQGLRLSSAERPQGKPDGLPELITEKDILGDLHCHSDWDGGRHTILEMARAAQDRGYQYLGISDHTKFLRIEHGLDEKQLLAQKKEIERLNSQLQTHNSKLKILQGCEANILDDGSIDIKDEVLEKLDYVIAGVHSRLKMPREQMTRRVIKALQNPNCDIVSHPTGRILQKRDEFQIDFEQILRVAQETGTILEINGSPERLDLKDANIRRAKEVGVKMAVGSDAHNQEQLKLLEFGVAQARRGWAEKKDIVNTWPLEELRDFLRN